MLGVTTIRWLVSLWVLCASSHLIAQHNVDDWRYQQARIVYNISKFVIWKQHEGEEFGVCLLGEDRIMHEAFTVLQGKLLRGKKLVFQQLAMPEDSQILYVDPAICPVLFISPMLEGRWQTDILPQIQQQAILSISDIPEFAQVGGMIGLIPTVRRVRFTINLDQARQADLQIRAPLLQMAKLLRSE